MADPISVTLYSPGAIPGIPGIHTPGDYTLDYDARTIVPVVSDDGSGGETQTLSDGQVDPSTTDQVIPPTDQPPA